MLNILSLLTIFFLISCESNLSGQSSNLTSGDSETSSSSSSSTESSSATGTIIGKITDASDGSNLSDVSITLSSGETVTTDSIGEFSITGVSVGSISMTLSKSGYSNQTISVTVIEDQTTSASVSLLTTAFATNKITIILSWGATSNGAPADLDASLYVPVTSSSTTKVNYSAKGNISSSPFALLDVDDTNGDGPETITINYTGSSLPYSRTYRYYVHNYSQGAQSQPETFSSSSAVVRIYINGTLQNTFTVSSSNTNYYWHVFDISSDGSIVEQNQYSNSVPATLY